MQKYIILLIVGGVLILLATIIFIIMAIHNNRLKKILYKINKAEEKIREKLKVKYDLIIRSTNIIENKLKIESKVFEETKKIKSEKITSFKTDKQLNTCYTEILKIKEDKDSLINIKSFKEILSDLDDNELYIVSLRTFYNKYSMEYNAMVKTFPYKLVRKIKKYKLKTLFDGKEIGEDFKNDFIV